LKELISQGANKPGGKKSRGQNGKGVKKGVKTIVSLSVNSLRCGELHVM